MNTPLKLLSALALAVSAGSPLHAAPPVGGSTDPGAAMSPVPDNMVGPLAPNQCYASQCPGAMAPAEAALDPKTLERQMLTNGTYTYLKQTDAGSVFQLKDGRWSYDDGKACLLPMSLDKLMARCAADAKLPPDQQQIPASIRDAVAQAAKAQMDKNACGSLNESPDCNKMSINAISPIVKKDVAGQHDATHPAADAPETVAPTGDPTGGGTTATSEDQTDLSGLAGIIGDPTGGETGQRLTSGQNGQKGPDADFKRETEATLAAINADVTTGAKIDPGSFGFVNTRKAARSPTVGLLQSGQVFADPKTNGDNTTRGGNTAVFGLGGSK